VNHDGGLSLNEIPDQRRLVKAKTSEVTDGSVKAKVSEFGVQSG
jgi:hypothetical protein